MVSGAIREAIRFTDIDADGRDDHLRTSDVGAVHAYINDGGGGAGGFTEYLDFANETGYAGDKSTFPDISGDGKADYVVVYDGGSVRTWLNRAGNTES